MSDYLQVWEEPVRGGYPDPSTLTLSGLERMRAWVKGQIPEPPVSRLIGMRAVEAGVGTAIAHEVERVQVAGQLTTAWRITASR